MTRKNKKLIGAIFIIVVTIIAWFLWLSLRPVKIVAVHHDGNYSDVLVDHFPLTTKGKIVWWQENKDMLKRRYGIPHTIPDGGYNITFWLFGDGYMERERYDDRLCFIDMKTQKNCIEKNKTFTGDYSKNTGLFFTTYAGYFYIKDNGEIAKRSF